jgi:DNA (cytosine-5)-methyltransferase 1
MKYLSVCSGMEAASVAWHPLGWTPVGFSEIEPFPCAILKHRFPNVPNYGSLTEYQSWPLEQGAVDLLVGGTPCQSFSVAGLRKGLADPRGNLALTFLGLADKLKPRWIVWENVPGVLSSGGGRDFGSFLGALVELGYGFAYRVLDAQHFGVPQRRRRVFVVAHLGDWRAAAEVLSLSEGLRGYLETGNKKRKSPASDAGAGVEAGGVHSSSRQGFGTRANPDIASTLETTCNDYSRSDCFTAVVEDRGSPKSHWEGGEIHPTLNQAHNIGSPGYSNQELFSQGGAGLVPTPYRKSKRAASTIDNETWVLANSSNTLNNFDLGDTRTTHAVVQPIPIQDGREMDKKQNGLGIANQGDPAYTIDTTGAQAIAIQGTIIGRGENAGPQGTGATEGGPMFTLTKTDIHGVCHQMPGTVAPTIGASGPPYSRTGNERVEAEALAVTTVMENSRRDAIRIYEGTSPTLQSFMGTGGCNVPMVQPAMAVRRLTPVECERLQGFPDNWSRISWKGKPEDQCPDGPRYKACGNSMAVPVMAFIGKRIAEVEAKGHQS